MGTRKHKIIHIGATKNNLGLTNSQIKEMDKIDKIREPFLKKYNKCKTLKCSSKKKMEDEKKRYFKEEKKQCSKIVDNSEYYNCADKLYKKSKYKKLFEKWMKCGITKCSKEFEDLRNSTKKNSLQ